MSVPLLPSSGGNRRNKFHWAPYYSYSYTFCSGYESPSTKRLNKVQISSYPCNLKVEIEITSETLPFVYIKIRTMYIAAFLPSYFIKQGKAAHIMKACIGSRGTAPLILNLGTRWRWVQNVMFLPFHPWTKNYKLPWKGGYMNPRTSRHLEKIKVCSSWWYKKSRIIQSIAQSLYPCSFNSIKSLQHFPPHIISKNIYSMFLSCTVEIYKSSNLNM